MEENERGNHCQTLIKKIWKVENMRMTSESFRGCHVLRLIVINNFSIIKFLRCLVISEYRLSVD